MLADDGYGSVFHIGTVQSSYVQGNGLQGLPPGLPHVLEDRIRPHYPRAGIGRRPYPLEAMLRVHCVQLFYNLSDPAMEDLLYEV